jgi:hypothetical protein
MLVPTKYVPMMLDAGLSPKDAWLRVQGEIEANGEMVACAPLIDWLRLAITCYAVGQPSRLTIGYPNAPPMHSPTYMATLLNYCWQFVHSNITSLNVIPVAQDAQQIMLSLTALVSEQCLMRQDKQTRRADEKNKNPSSYFGADVLRLLRWCQVANETLLPNIWK